MQGKWGWAGEERESDQKEMYTSNHDRKVRFAKLQSIKRQDFRETI